MNGVKKLVYLAIIISQALVLHYLEHFIPPLAPGAKLGLANIMTIVTLALFGFKEAMAVVVIRSVAGPLLGGSPTAILYSLTGGVFSALIMSLLYRHRRFFSLLGISTAGAVFHNLGQLLVASVLFGTFGILFTYLPLLMAASIVTGNFVGLVSGYLLRYLQVKAPALVRSES